MASSWSLLYLCKLLYTFPIRATLATREEQLYVAARLRGRFLCVSHDTGPEVPRASASCRNSWRSVAAGAATCSVTGEAAARFLLTWLFQWPFCPHEAQVTRREVDSRDSCSGSWHLQKELSTHRWGDSSPGDLGREATLPCCQRLGALRTCVVTLPQDVALRTSLCLCAASVGRLTVSVTLVSVTVRPL